MFDSFLQASFESYYMVLVASVASIGLGLILGIILFISQKNSLWPKPVLHCILGMIVNITRSVPFIILLISLIPLTRILVGTSIGTTAAIIPLTIAAIPFYARIAQSALQEVSWQLIEAGMVMGASKTQLVYKILLPEAASTLVRGATLTIISLIGYSAMAGAVGGGGLGQLAIDYGYQRFNPTVMIITVVVLVAFVQLVQVFGDLLAKRPRFSSIISLVIFLSLVCGAAYGLIYHRDSNEVLTVGIVGGPQQETMDVAKKLAKDNYQLDLNVIVFDDYVLPNTALNEGSIDANIFQHIPYLDAQIQSRGYDLVPVAKTFIYPFGFYSNKIHSIDELSTGDLVGIPNDPSNEGRALLLLDRAGIIRIDHKAGLLVTPKDILDNPRRLQFKLLAAAQLPRAMNDLTMVGLTNDYAIPAGFQVKHALLHEGQDSPYANVIVTRPSLVNSEKINKLIKIMHSKEIIANVEKNYPNGAAIAVPEIIKK